MNEFIAKQKQNAHKSRKERMKMIESERIWDALKYWGTILGLIGGFVVVIVASLSTVF
jgi:hypothetical protein